MQYYYVTGANRGIGRGLVDRLLQIPDATVIGVGRTSSVEHPHYRHLTLDLRDMQAVQAFQFELHPDATRIVLVNNAGALTVKPIGHERHDSIINDYLVNLVSLTVLANAFIATYAGTGVEKVLLNISSGAGARPTDGWAVYCAGKAGVDMLSRCIELEQQRAPHPVRVLSVAPGVVDTDMQGVIRATDAADFSRVEEFVGFKESGALADPTVVAEKLVRVIDNPALTPNVVFSLRDIQL